MRFCRRLWDKFVPLWDKFVYPVPLRRSVMFASNNHPSPRRRRDHRGAPTSTGQGGHCAPPIFAVQRDRDRWIVRGPTPERFGDSVGIVAVVDMHVGRRSATVLRMTENEVFTALPCLSGACLDHRADRLRCRIGAFYLRALAGEKPAVPPLSEILRNCCKNEFASFTLAKPRHHGRSSPLFWEKPR